MKYNRQQKYNFCSAVKTILLLLLMCFSIGLCYSYLKIRQKNLVILNSIELQKTQISDLESLSRANKGALKNLKDNIENQKLNLRKLTDTIGIGNKNIQAEKSFIDVQHLHKNEKENYENLSNRLNEQYQTETQKYEKEKDIRSTRIEELGMEISKLRDAVANLKKKKSDSGISKVSEKVKNQSNQEDKLKASLRKPIPERFDSDKSLNDRK